MVFIICYLIWLENSFEGSAHLYVRSLLTLICATLVVYIVGVPWLLIPNNSSRYIGLDLMVVEDLRKGL